MSSIHDLWHVVKSRVCENRGIQNTRFNSETRQDNCIKSRSVQILVLEIVLHKHRQRFATKFEPLENEKALHHLIFTKTMWKPSEIRELTFADSLLVIQDELRTDKLPEDIKHFIEEIGLPSFACSFEELLDSDWAPTQNSVFLNSIS